jgi:hypothetical protein
MITEEVLTTRLAELRKQQEQIVAKANLQLAAIDGRIQEVAALLKTIQQAETPVKGDVKE